jgi:hypothetical protein
LACGPSYHRALVIGGQQMLALYVLMLRRFLRDRLN